MEAVVDTVPVTVAFPVRVGEVEPVPHRLTVAVTEGLALADVAPVKEALTVGELEAEADVVAVAPSPGEGVAVPLPTKEGVPPRGLALGQLDTEGEPEGASDSLGGLEAVAQPVDDALEPTVRELDADKLGDPEARALPLPVTDAEGLREAAEEEVADAAEEAERDAPMEPLASGDGEPVGEPGMGLPEPLRDPVTDCEGAPLPVREALPVRVVEGQGVLEEECDSEGVVVAGGREEVLLVRVAVSQKLPVEDTEAVAPPGDGVTEPQGEAPMVALPHAVAVMRAVPVGEALSRAEAEAERETAAEAVAGPVAEGAPDAVGQGVTEWVGDTPALAEPLPLALALRVASEEALPHAVAVGVGEREVTASVPLGVLDTLAVAHTEGDAAREPDGESEVLGVREVAAETEEECEAEGHPEEEREGDADAVGVRVEEALPDRVPDTVLHAERDVEKLALPEALWQWEVPALVEAVALREGESVPVAEREPVEVAQGEGVSLPSAGVALRRRLGEGTPVKDTGGEALRVGASGEPEALAEAERVAEGDWEGECEGEVEALVALPGEALPSGVAVPHTEAVGEGVSVAPPVRDVVGVSVTASDRVPLAHTDAEGVPEVRAVALGQRDAEEQGLAVRELLPHADTVGVPLLLTEAQREGESDALGEGVVEGEREGSARVAVRGPLREALVEPHGWATRRGRHAYPRRRRRWRCRWRRRLIGPHGGLPTADYYHDAQRAFEPPWPLPDGPRVAADPAERAGEL